MSDEDDTAEDPQLTRLRSVWTTMRDEDPPTRGLAALMAAAREQAEVMKPREAWWQRVLVTLRRPPVLALATLVLVIGGGVVLSQHGGMKYDAISDEHPASESAAPEPVVSVAPTPSFGSAAATAGDRVASERTDLEATQDAPKGGAGRGTISPPAPPPAPRTVTVPPASIPAARERPAMAPKPTRSSAAASPAKNAKSANPGTDSPPAVSSPVVDLRAKGDAPGGASMEIAVDQMSASPAAPAAPVEDATAPARRGALTVDQMIQQCAALAAKGDCVAARQLAAKISTADPKAYQARVVTQTAIARCLATSTAN